MDEGIVRQIQYEIRRILENYFSVNDDHEVIIRKSRTEVIVLDAENFIKLVNPETTESKNLFEMDDEYLWEVHSFLEANKHTLECQESIIEHQSPEEKKWHIEPQEVKNRDEVIGLIGTEIVETVEEGDSLLGVVFISPDGTYSTLTMYGSKVDLDKKVAHDDLISLAKHLLQNAENLTK